MGDSDKEVVEDNIDAADFASLMTKAVCDLGISAENISGLASVKVLKCEGRNWRQRHQFAIFAGVLALMILVFPSLFYKSIERQSTVGSYFAEGYLAASGRGSLAEEVCLVPIPELLQDPFRPPVNCNECVNVTGVHRVTNLSHADFLEKYAFTMQPVLVKDGQDGWTAREQFSFDFFREVYKEGSEALEKVTSDCQFFPYQTEFNNLGEMLNMSRDRVEGKEKPWYVGWSNCDGKAANMMRKHYKFPYFLPPELDHSKTDWVFMGLPGYGANIHIDHVGTLSWQAQVKGIKRWILEPPPECVGICISRMEIIVEPGDIIVLDTNKWYHGTLILGNETSIVIGSEYY